VKATELVTTNVIEVVAMPLFASITLTVKVELPVLVGVRDDARGRQGQAGRRVPAFTDQVYGWCRRWR